MNAACNDPDAAGNGVFTPANHLWIVVRVVMRGLIAFDLFSPAAREWPFEADAIDAAIIPALE